MMNRGSWLYDGYSGSTRYTFAFGPNFIQYISTLFIYIFASQSKHTMKYSDFANFVFYFLKEFYCNNGSTVFLFTYIYSHLQSQTMSLHENTHIFSSTLSIYHMKYFFVSTYYCKLTSIITLKKAHAMFL